MSDPLRARFEGVDTDADGKIDEAELGRLLDALGVGFTTAQVHATFTSIDTDQSGRIELEEFRAWWTSR
jgi:Ca2+-binding EF-hand superfamily protein